MFKMCIKCEVEKLATTEYFHVSKGNRDGLAGKCKECKNAESREYNIIHKKEIAEHLKVYRKVYYEKNKEKFSSRQKAKYKMDKEGYAKRAKEYQKKHRLLLTINEQKHRAKKAKLPHTLTEEQWQSIKAYFNNKCAYCGEEKPLAQDHFYPLYLGGEYAISNIICACKRCNSSKHSSTFMEWYPKQAYYSKQREKKVLSYLKYKNNNQQLSFA